MTTDLESSPRFQSPPERRDFLGLASLWSAGIALGMGLFGVLRLPVPAVFPESNSRVSLGPRERFQEAKATWFAEYRLWVYGDDQGHYAVSAICPHLGCTVSAPESGGYFCPCHGSRFNPAGGVVAGPAPGPLVHFELSISPDGQLVVDQQKEVGADVRLKM